MAIKDIISSIVVFLFSLSAYILAADFGGGAELFPRGLAIIMMIASGLMFLRAVFWPRLVPEGESRMEMADVKRTAVCVLITIAYVALIVPLGFATASIAFIIAIAYAMGYRNHLALWLTAVLFVGTLYLMFVRVFHTPLPEDIIFGLFH
ncbi:tripartite tricarboxylate transporter TctB family protein [Sinorhizobium mexicanum]|uniref:Tripartite tricarboxylate transporter TctB family protein n=1 Tax=Sinorhizobium mexicanum TaxID=375549 RepID=A0A859QD55_9HYPH|nr:tripartite tricarboxylate transporter TctB family protein [Sinorhizobium mexicanum]MBP1883782.1 fatty acid desaturase [Sinorhizobium mexicanum]QLL62953.1 tripartite tricarboxylate transporter TctB family protein [Sinorhizobium mexicanum]